MHKTILGYHWQRQQADSQLVAQLMQQHSELTGQIAQILVARGVSCDSVNLFLNPKLRDSMPNPFHLIDMKKAANVLASAITKKEKIVIFGDYDVDGATSSALLTRFLRMSGVDDSGIYIPDRIKDGYGPNINAINKLHKEGYSLMITVDCGTTSFEPIAAAAELGMKVIVVDHHLSAAQMPPGALAVVNPNRYDETSPLTYLAAVGMSFLLAVATSTELGHERSRLMELLDLVALGTVCDVMPLTGLNRAFVASGLHFLNIRKNAGIRAIAQSAGITEKLTAEDLGFIIGPRINAGGRVGESSLGARILCTEDEIEAATIAERLELYNKERRTLEQLATDELIEALDNRMAGIVSVSEQIQLFAELNSSIIIAASKAWHPGIVGIVASRIKDRFHRPVAIISLMHDLPKASCRSISGINFGAAIFAAKAAGLVIEGGGHSAAGGFSVDEKKLPELYRFWDSFMTQDYQLLKDIKPLKIDGDISCSMLNMNFIEELEQLAPFGVGNPRPRLAICNAIVLEVKALGQDGKHFRLTLSQKNLGKMIGRVNAVIFRAEQHAATILALTGREIDIVGTAVLNRFNGKEAVQFIIDDIVIPIPLKIG